MMLILLKNIFRFGIDWNMSSSRQKKKSIIRKIDRLLGIYYLSKNRNDYYDENGNGKFYNFCEEYGFDDDILVWVLQGDDIDKNLLVMLFFPQNGDFPCYEPLRDSDPEKHQKEQFLRLIRSYVISWWNIAECLKHEMYTAIYSKMHEVIEENKASINVYDLDADAIDKFISMLQNKKQLSNREVIFIQNAVRRARGASMWTHGPSTS